MMQHPTSLTPTTAKPRRLGAVTRIAAALGLLMLAATGLSFACGGSVEEQGSKPTPEEQCDDAGGVWLNNVCEGKCTPDKCIAENTCVGNRCVLKCDAHTDCYPDGSQNCSPATEDDTNAAITTCQANEVPKGMGIKCPFKAECDGLGICPNGKGCERYHCGFQPDLCVRDAAACGDNQDCTIGKCPDGTGCAINPCLAAECKALACQTTGEGDADAYCTRQDCASDADCAGGFYCGITRDPHEICNSDPQKGDNNLCGMTSEACINKSALGQGNTLFEGSMCILRKTCLKRGQCAPCATDLDCSQLPLQTCKQIGGEGRCARACSLDKDCDPDYACLEGSCIPRFGACKGSGNFCEPCQSDEDCASNGTRKACIEASGGQRACFNYEQFATPCDPAKGCVECTTDLDCPASPSGRHGECFDEGEGYTPSDAVYHRCYLPYDAPDNKFECW
jgi:hypothetical protein